MEFLWQDLKYGLRTLTRSPGFAAVAVFSLALGIGANTAIFTLIDTVFLNPLPVAEPARVMQVYTVDHSTKVTAANLTRTPVSFLNYKDFRDQNNVFTGLAAFVPAGVTLTGRGEPKPQPVQLVSANYFDLLGVKAALGRTFLPDEDRKDGGNAVTVLSHSLWVRVFGGDPGVLGRTVQFNLVPYTIIGVAPPGFKGTFTVANPEVAWIPISMHAQVLSGPLEALFNERRLRMINIFGRLKPGLQPAQSLAAMQTIAARLEREYPLANKGRTVEMASLSDAALGFLPRNQIVVAGIALTAVVALVLLIACVNLANLLLARSAKRAREMALRTALGAERGRLVRQLLTESFLLAAAGGAAGFLLGWAGCRLLWNFRPSFLPQNSISLQMDWRVFAFTAAVTLLTGILFGLAPASRASIPNLNQILKTGGRGGAEASGHSLLRSVLVVCQIALALIALAGAGLFIRSMERVQKINPGFETRNLFVFNFDLASQPITPDRGRQFLRSVLEKASAIPGVRSTALASNPPLAGGLLRTVLAEGQEAEETQRGTLTVVNAVTPGYFDTMRIPVLDGRPFTDFDRPGQARVAIVNQAMARHFWPSQNAMGKRFRFINERDYFQVVGVAGNSVALAIGETPQPIAYLPLEQNYQPALALHVRTSASPEAVLPAALREVQSLNSNLALTNPNTIHELIGQGLWAPRMGAALFGIFGLLGMALASIGIYGVMAYMVTLRTNEIGIRMALGAQPRDVLRLVVLHGMRLAAVGILLGVAGGLALTRLIRSLLFDVAPYDAPTFATVSLALAGVAFAAGWLPARRAARIDPVVTLRGD